MVDRKFENLPGIAHDEPDVYETPDVTEEETSDYFEETENECIERLHISTKDAYKKFKGKYLIGHVDFSDRIGRKLRSGYDARSGDWEYGIGGDERETPVQKCQRLQHEMNELMQELSDLNADATLSKENRERYEAIGTVVNNAKKVLDSLRLERVLGSEAVAAASDSEVKKLFALVEDYKKSGSTMILPSANAPNDLAFTTRIAEMETRLHQLESAVGAEPEKLSRLTANLGSNSLLDAVQHVSTKAALLQPAQLDLIETRIGSLASKMDAMAVGENGSSKDPVAEQRMIELYAMAKRTEPITHLLPNMLQRMQALENLHNYANNFSKIIAELEATQSTLLTSLSGNKALLQNIQEAFAVNLANVKKEVTKLDARLTAIGSKIK